MAMCPGGGLLMLGSSVYRRRGYMFRQYRELHGNDLSPDSICWFSPSAVMNPVLPAHVIERALQENAPKARAEFLNIWREDLSDFIPIDVVQGATEFGMFERPWRPGVMYFAACNSAGGTGQDSFTLAIAHKEGDHILIDAVREAKPRFIPAQVIAEYAQLLKSYHVYSVQSDKFAGGFHSSEWTRNGISFVPFENTTSENYLAALPLLLARRVVLVDHATLRHQLISLERHVGAADRETVSHPQHANAHDDIATSVCGALVACASSVAQDYSGWRDDLDDPASQAAADAAVNRAYEAARLRDHLAACGAPVGGMPRASSTIGGIPVSGWPMSFGRRWW